MGAYWYFYFLQPTTYHLRFLVAECINRLLVYVKEFYDFVPGAPQMFVAAEIDTPRRAVKVGVVAVRGDATVVIQALYDEVPASDRESPGREENRLTARESVHIIYAGCVADVIVSIKRHKFIRWRRTVLGKGRRKLLERAEIPDALILAEGCTGGRASGHKDGVFAGREHDILFGIHDARGRDPRPHRYGRGLAPRFAHELPPRDIDGDAGIRRDRELDVLIAGVR